MFIKAVPDTSLDMINADYHYKPLMIFVRCLCLPLVVPTDDEIVEYHCMACLTNLGDVSIYAVPSLKTHMKANAVKKDDIWYVAGYSAIEFYWCKLFQFYVSSFAWTNNINLHQQIIVLCYLLYFQWYSIGDINQRWTRFLFKKSYRDSRIFFDS